MQTHIGDDSEIMVTVIMNLRRDGAVEISWRRDNGIPQAVAALLARGMLAHADATMTTGEIKKEGSAEASPKGVQPPGEKQPPGNTGA